MNARIVSISSVQRQPKAQANVLQEGSAWLTAWLKARGGLTEARAVWDAWPPLETASLKLARLLGQGMKDMVGKSAAGEAVARAVLAFRSKKASGSPGDRAARAYLEALLECSELLVCNRIEAGNDDMNAELLVWDPTLGPYDDWCEKLPDNYEISSHFIPAGPGEYSAARSQLAGLILNVHEYARIFYGPREEVRGVK